LPSNASAELREKLVKESVETALESRGGKNESGNMVGMTEDEAEKWLQNHPKEESFFSDILTAKFLRVGTAENESASSPMKRMPKLLGSSLLCECPFFLCVCACFFLFFVRAFVRACMHACVRAA
jgi:hypothetical protein